MLLGIDRMILSRNQLLAFNKDSLKEFVSLQIQEGLYLDYKKELTTPFNDAAKREFLKDVSAFANSAGGLLVIGCREPADSLSTEDQIVGVADGPKWASTLENMASASIDPRIPGLLFHVVDVGADKYCILVYVPQSLARPHMVVHTGHRAFYSRSSESTFPMSTHDIRQAVLSSASAVANAKAYSEERFVLIQERFGADRPMLFIQAVPIIPPDSSWDVLSEDFSQLAFGHDIYRRYPKYHFASNGYLRRPIIEGISWSNSRTHLEWEVEIHRTGYISALIIQMEKHKERDKGPEEVPVLHAGYNYVFRSFCEILAASIALTKTDVPYQITSVHPNAQKTYFLQDRSIGRAEWTPSDRSSIRWPVHFRQTGQDPLEIAEQMILEMHYAFGIQENSGQ